MEYSKSIQSRASSSTTPKYDVFLSFRGDDVRNTFADHLFAAFKRKAIVAFRDDTNLKQGDHISTELMQAIEGSQVLIVVFSKNYANSSWCLQELTKIVDCVNMEVPTGQSLLPVFYDVSPSEVRKQSGDYGKAMAEHEERFKRELVQEWRKALTQVANLSGWDIQNKPQHKEIEKIVEKVMNTVRYKLSSFDGLVGMHSRVEQLEKLLDSDFSDDIRVVGIHGMGGIGKTTVARAVYERNLHQYDTSCYIDDVTKVYRDSGAIGVQKLLIRQALNEENQDISNVSKATYLIKNRLPWVKSFIVLDNVDKDEQLEKLGINRECLHPGSRMIIISRDRHILDKYVDEVYSAELLKKDEAHELFCKKAFKSGYIMSCDDICSEYKALIDLALQYAQCLPLAVEVLGSFLCGKNISEWRSALARLRDSPNNDIMDVLQISFDGLDPTEKEIFLDIACFFGFRGKNDVEEILDCCGFHSIIGIRVLADKSLIIIRGSVIIMHDKLQELGKKVVRQKAPNEPGKWSRLWRIEDFCNVMYLDMAMCNLEAIMLKAPSETEEYTTLKADVLSKMKRLRLLSLDNVDFSGSLNCLSNKLQYLYWHKYPFTYFPSSCELSKLVILRLRGSNIKKLWEGIKPMYSLKTMDLSHSKFFFKTPDFGGTPNLEKLILQGCTKLVHIHPSIGNLKRLVLLDLKNCISLTSLPNNIFCVRSLEVVDFRGCSKLFDSGMQENARHDISDSTIQCQSTSSIFKRIKLMLPSPFFMYRRQDSVKPSSLSRLQCLVMLDLSFCNLVNIPDAVAELCCLESLDLAGNSFVTLPSFMMELPRLIWLKLDYCKQLTYLSEFPLRTILPTQRKRRNAGLCMFSCPKLIEMASWSGIVLSWMIQFLKVHKDPYPSITIVIPGTEIPSWFNCQNVGNSIRLEPRPNVNDSNWVGVAFCAAFVVQYHPPSPSDLADHENPMVYCFTDYEVHATGYSVAEIIETDGVTSELVHLCLQYFTRPHLIDAIEHAGIHCLRVMLTSFGNRVNLDVKHCGMRIIYKQDLEELIDGDE